MVDKLREAIKQAQIARFNFTDMIPDTTLSTWVVIKLLDAIEDSYGVPRDIDGHRCKTEEKDDRKSEKEKSKKEKSAKGAQQK